MSIPNPLDALTGWLQSIGAQGSTSTPGAPLHSHLQQQADGSWVLIDDDTGMVVSVDPYGGGAQGDTTTPASQVPTLGPNPAAPQTSSGAGPPPMADWQQFLIWIGALAVLWFLLNAIAEGGYPDAAHGLAGLLLVGALIFMGPTAITNAQSLTQPRKA